MLSKIYNKLFVNKSRINKAESEFWIDFIFQYCLGRCAEPSAKNYYVSRLENGTKLSEILMEVRNSGEAITGNTSIKITSDSEFIIALGELFFPNGGALPQDIEFFNRLIQGNANEKNRLLEFYFSKYIDSKHSQIETNDYQSKIWLMGTDEFIDNQIWTERFNKLKIHSSSSVSSAMSVNRRELQVNDSYEVSVIVSLFKGSEYIRSFLEMILSQTYLKNCEIIFIDANSPEGEESIICEYMKSFSNIVYKRINYTIGIYEAWNTAIQMARGKYITNANLDDIRAPNSIEIQAAYLNNFPFVDAVYQDFYYTLDYNLTFNQIRDIGFKSSLPNITANKLLTFNPLHNAPMWRRNLHDELGLFDTTFKSAGDWEFWLRCLEHNKIMLKTPGEHVAYFHNPKGISTKKDTLGHNERKKIINIYSRKLIPQTLRMNRNEFLSNIPYSVSASDSTTIEYKDAILLAMQKLAENR